MAPAGQDTVTAIVRLPPFGERRSGLGSHPGIRLAGMSSAGYPFWGSTDLEKHIKFETIFTPQSWRKRYNLVKGATHGLCQT